MTKKIILNPSKPDDQLKLPFIEHRVKEISINQRAYDGYIDATALCKASGKRLNDYLRGATTKAFLSQLSTSTGIPADLLVQIIKGGNPKLQGQI